MTEGHEGGATISEQPRITKLIIEKDKNLSAKNASSKQIFKVKGVSLLRGDSNRRGYDYYKLKDLAETRAISITLREKDETKDVEMPEDMLDRMADYLSNMNSTNGNGRFDCVSFVQAVNGIPYEYTKYDPSKWNQSNFNGDVKVGDTIAIVDSDAPQANQYTHFAIYLGDGLYISKFGFSGPLIVSDVDEMKKGFHGDTVYKLEPKQ